MLKRTEKEAKKFYAKETELVRTKAYYMNRPLPPAQQIVMPPAVKNVAALRNKAKRQAHLIEANRFVER